MPGLGVTEVTTLLLIICLFNLLPILVLVMLYIIIRRLKNIEDALKQTLRDRDEE